VLDAASHLKQPHFLYDCGPLATLRFSLLCCHCMKPVTLKTSLSARYCMLFTVRYCWTNELKDYTKDCNGQIAWLTAVSTLPYSVLDTDVCSILY